MHTEGRQRTRELSGPRTLTKLVLKAHFLHIYGEQLVAALELQNKSDIVGAVPCLNS